MSFKQYVDPASVPGGVGSAEYAAALDAALDAVVPSKRSEFAMLPSEPGARYRPVGSPAVYLCGNSLGLAPKRTRAYISEELTKWETHGVEGHFRTNIPWVSIEDSVVPLSEPLVGARPGEVAVMGSLTSNLHACISLLYRPALPPLPADDDGAAPPSGAKFDPSVPAAAARPARLRTRAELAGGRYKILTEAKAFPSDTYAVGSQLLLHGVPVEEGLVEVAPRPGESLLRREDILAAIAREGPSLAMVLFSGVQYYTGQLFDIPAIVAAAHAVGAVAGIDLAHAVGNVPLQLHDWGVDFACWCSYKYLNSGPGGIAGLFLHSRYANDSIEERPFQAGWWGNVRTTRFKMGAHFDGQPGAGRLQVSNVPVLTTTALRASLEVFAEAGGMAALRTRSLALTSYLEALLTTDPVLSAVDPSTGTPLVSVLTPADPGQRGAQLSLVFAHPVRAVFNALGRESVIVDIREPNAMRVSPAPLYNTAADVAEFVRVLKAVLAEVEAAGGNSSDAAVVSPPAPASEVGAQ